MGATLTELRVRNLGVIDDVTVPLGAGMTALTGETGAGKTLLVEALGLLLGGRSDPSMVRTGADEAVVEGRFVDPVGEEVILARSVVRHGRGRAWIDGRMASLAALTEAASGLVELHGQHQHQSLLHADAQRRALDTFAGVDPGPLESARGLVRRLTGELADLGGDPRQRVREVDLLRYQLDEIETAAITGPDEDERLEAEEDRLSSVEAHRLAAANALDALDDPRETGAIDRLAQASRAVGGRPPLAAVESGLRAAMADLADLATELRTVVETWDDDPARLEEIRARRQHLRELRRKYGDDLGEVLAFAEGARARLAAIDRDEERARALDAEIRAARRAEAEAAAAVAAARREAAPRLAAAIQSTLRGLAMPSARLQIEVGGEDPADRVVVLLGANPGEPLQPLAKVASGGELARTMLAVRLAITGDAGVLVFDEVDAGVGGAAATAVGSALAELSGRAQVLVVTHLAQVAAQAGSQVAVRKSESGGRTRAEVDVLGAEARVVELSRMLSGRPESASARRHARELLEGASSTG